MSARSTVAPIIREIFSRDKSLANQAAERLNMPAAQAVQARQTNAQALAYARSMVQKGGIAARVWALTGTNAGKNVFQCLSPVLLRQ